MSKTLTIELPDDLYEAVHAAAAARGEAPGDWVASRLRKAVPPPIDLKALEETRRTFDDLKRQMAVKEGLSYEEFQARWSEKYGPKPQPVLTDEQREAAWKKLEPYIGTEGLGHPTGTDNEMIDADLAREYGDTHEGEA